MRYLDETDRRIVTHLQNNARLSNKELAALVDLAPSTCLNRVRKLENAGILTGYHANVSLKAVGLRIQALVAVKLRRHSTPDVESFQRHAQSLEEVVQIFHVTGQSDFLVHVVVRDTEHLRELGLSAFTERPEVERIETSLVFWHANKHTIPLYGPAETT